MNPIAGYDFTMPSTTLDKDEIIKFLNTYCKKWVFQLEEGEEGYKHYQGRLSLNSKKRMNMVIKMFHHIFPNNKAHLTPTMVETFVTNNFNYVMKEDSRIDGPWKDSDRALPKQVRNITNLYQWQRQVIESRLIFNERNINIIIDPKGCSGKTTIKTIIGASKYGISIPALKDYKDLMRMVMCQDKLGLYIIDLPRGMKKENMEQFFSAVETIKDGYAFDERYHFKDEYFDSPVIWIFTNTMPDTTLLSKDRWIFWRIDNTTHTLHLFGNYN
jgi:hypothetical protein